MSAGNIGPDLLAECLANRRTAQRALYDRSLPALSTLARRYLRNDSDLKDVLQDSYLQIFQKLGQYDAAKASFLTWASRVVINNCLKRNAKQQQQATDELCTENHAPALDPEVLAKIGEAELRTWLKRMPAELHTVFLLHVVDGFPHKDIAGMLSIEPALSRQRLSRARKWLARELNVEPGKTSRVFPLPRRLNVAPLIITVFAFINQTS